MMKGGAALFAFGVSMQLAVAATSPPYLLRGDEVEASYKLYTEKLVHAYSVLKQILKTQSPDLYKKLAPAPPKPVSFGYQLVPRLQKDAPYEERHDTPRAISTPYSWERTLRFIENEVPRIEEIEEQLKAAQSIPLSQRRGVYERWAREYPILENNQRLVDTHIQYNRFWQRAIADDRTRFDRLTRLHDVVLARQALLDALAAKTDADFLRNVRQVPGIDHNLPRAMLEDDLKALDRKMAAIIHSQNSDIKVPRFLKLEHPTAHSWKITAPICTDIGDTKFLSAAKQAIESLWSIDEKENMYKMTVVFRQITAAKLYAGAKVPRKGDHIDVKKHAARFPKDCAVLTTGINSTYAIPAVYIALGPQPISHNVLAHEFGHILGFIDGYFRGYRDLGEGGFEVLEIVPDPQDIMCTPGIGHVLPFHYEQVFKRK